MKITIEGTEEECSRGAAALARGYAMAEPAREPPLDHPMSRDEYLARTRMSSSGTIGLCTTGLCATRAFTVRECCKTDACRLPPSHPDYRSDP